MAIHSPQPIRTLALFTPAECIAWLTVFGIEAVAMVTINAIEIIIYLKEHSLRKRDMYLVINQAVADMFVGGYVIFECWRFGGNCHFWALNYFSVIAFSVLVISFYFFALASLLNLTAISLNRTLATFRPFKHRLVKKKIFGVVVLVIWITAGLFITSAVLTFSNRRRTLKVSTGIFLTHFSSFLFCLLIIILLSYSSTAIKIFCVNQPHHHGATNRERKLTKTLFIVTVVSLLLTLPYVILQIHFLVSVLSSKTISFRAWVRLFYYYYFF